MFKDKNTIIGFILLGLLFFAYFGITTMQSNETKMAREIEQRKKDSIANANKPKLTTEQVLSQKKDSIDKEQSNTKVAAGTFSSSLLGTEQLTTVENQLLTINFSNKGARPAVITLKHFKNFKNKPVQLLGDSADKFGYQITSGSGVINTAQLYYTLVSNTKNVDSSTTIIYTTKDSTGKALTHTYTIKPNSYLFDCTIQLQGADKLVTNNTINLTNNVLVTQQDNDISFERQVPSAAIPYLNDGEYDYYEADRTRNFNIEKPVKWIGVKQRFFNSTLFSAIDMKNVTVDLVKKEDSTHQLYAARTNMNVPLNNGVAALQFYTGPNDYKILSGIGMQTKNIVQLHSNPFGFVKWINRGVVLPVFDFIRNHITSSIGIAILILTLVIRLITAPLMMPGYRNSAKMKILKPELDKLKEKYNGDQQGFAVEQMKFLRQAGVNQLQGCIPAILQIPIFFALYALFTSNIGVRDESFLWASDLSKYDDVIKFGFNLWPLGSHLSLFAVTACITSFFISLYSMGNTPDQGNPVLKYMPYFFPIIMLFIFNNLPSALTWYYTVSNIVTLVIQYVIQKFVLKPEKLKAQIEANKKKVKPVSKFQERYQQMLEQQKQAQQQNKKK